MITKKQKTVRKEQIINPNLLWSHLTPQQQEKALQVLQNACRNLAQHYQKQANHHDTD